jgi:hypothetical protein
MEHAQELESELESEIDSELESEIDYEIVQHKHMIYKKPKNQYDMHLKLKFLQSYLKYINYCTNSYYSYDQNGNYSLRVWSFDDEEDLQYLEHSFAEVNQKIKETKQMKNKHQIFQNELQETYIKKCLHPKKVYKYIIHNDIDFGELNINDLIL